MKKLSVAIKKIVQVGQYKNSRRKALESMLD